jgi:hypothetical protein
LYKEIKENSDRIREIPEGNGGSQAGPDEGWTSPSEDWASYEIGTGDVGGPQASPNEGWTTSAEDGAHYETVK